MGKKIATIIVLVLVLLAIGWGIRALMASSSGSGDDSMKALISTANEQ